MKKQVELTSFSLKMVAIVCMFIDHLTASGAFVMNRTHYIIGRGIGRIAFPLFCFMIVEGYFHTKNRWKYLIRLLALALISEVPFDMLFSGVNLEYGYQNVFFTLAIGLLAILSIGEIDQYFLKRIRQLKMQTLGDMMGVLSVFTQLLVVSAFGYLATLLKTDYSANGVLLIVTIYFFERFFMMFKNSIHKYGEQKVKNMLAAFAVALWFVFYDMEGGGFNETFGFPAILLIYLYNGKRGNYKIPAYFFYAFYPIHLLLVVFIRNIYYSL